MYLNLFFKSLVIFFNFIKCSTIMLTNYNHSSVVYFNQTPSLEKLKCPSVCICHQYEQNLISYFVTDCSEIEFQLINDDLSPFTTHLIMAKNQLKQIQSTFFIRLSNLIMLDLKKNAIQEIHFKAFAGNFFLETLDLGSNKLKHVPVAITILTNLKELFINNNLIETLYADTFVNNQFLEILDLKTNPIKIIRSNAFRGLNRLKKLLISQVKQVTLLPDWPALSSLEHLMLERSKITSIDGTLCRYSNHLKVLNAKSNKIDSIYWIDKCSQLQFLDLSYNNLKSLESRHFSNLNNLTHLFLSHNLIERLDQDCFIGLNYLIMLDLSYNQIKLIHPEAFSALSSLKDLNLGFNHFSHLPSKGLQNLRHIKVHGNPKLTSFPNPLVFPFIQTLALSYAYHCCQFESIAHPVNENVQENVIWLSKDSLEDSNLNLSSATLINFNNLKNSFHQLNNHMWTLFSNDFKTAYLNWSLDKSSIDLESISDFENFSPKHTIQCLPHPGPFLPCEDLFDWWALRCSIWIVCLFALVGNGVVLTVLIFGKSKLDVPRFLVCNLALADIFMGIYLGILATADAVTFGKFKIYAITWQSSIPCQFAGFLGVFSNELSVYTLSVITLERYYAITHAMNLNKRLSLKRTTYIMTVGWLFSFGLALLPLFGISDYRKFAICLPFEVSDFLSRFYVLFLILINGLAFFILMGCYIRMYCALKGSQVWNSNDSRIAKRMAILVFTDFLCCAPISFFSLTAVFGFHLISVKWAKVFTVFVLPLNSCANPFLYAIFTKQFKKELIFLCKRSKSKKNEAIRNCSAFKVNLKSEKKCSLNDRICQCNPFLDQPCSRRVGLMIATLKSGPKLKNKPLQFSDKFSSLFELSQKHDSPILSNDKMTRRRNSWTSSTFNSALAKKRFLNRVDDSPPNRYKMRKLYCESKNLAFRKASPICPECKKPNDLAAINQEEKKLYYKFITSSMMNNDYHNEQRESNYIFSSVDSNRAETTDTSLSFDNHLASTSCPTISSSIDLKISIQRAESLNSIMDTLDPNLIGSDQASSNVSSNISLKTQIFNETRNSPSKLV